jgi:drug/metabolite transporter (DMT)-like permease
LLASIIPGFFVAIAEVHVSSALAGILAGMIPLTTLLFLVVVFREEPVHRHQVYGLVIGFAGLVVITGVWRGLGHNTWWAVALLIITVFSYGLVFPYIKHHLSPLELHPLTLASGQQIMATLTTLPIAAFTGVPHHATATGWIMVILLGVFAGGLAFMWNFETVAAWGSSTASTVEYVCAVVAVIEGVVWLHESIQWNQPVGGAIVILGALIGWGQLPRVPLRRRVAA